MGEAKFRPEPPQQPPVPWEFRIHKFKDIVLPTSTVTERFNFWNVEDNKVVVGYHGKSETSERAFGELVETGKGEYVFVVDESFPAGAAGDVLTLVAEDLRKTGMKITKIIRPDKKSGGAAN